MAQIWRQGHRISFHVSRAATAAPSPAAPAPTCVSLMQGDADPGTLPPNLASSGRMAPAMSEAALYAQLTHFARLLDPTLALARCKDDAERLQAQKCATHPCPYHPGSRLTPQAWASGIFGDGHTGTCTPADVHSFQAGRKEDVQSTCSPAVSREHPDQA